MCVCVANSTYFSLLFVGLSKTGVLFFVSYDVKSCCKCVAAVLLDDVVVVMAIIAVLLQQAVAASMQLKAE